MTQWTLVVGPSVGLAIGCAIFMLFGPVGGRTTWVQRNTITTDAAGYNMAALLSGVVALAALVGALASLALAVIWPRHAQSDEARLIASG